MKAKKLLALLLMGLLLLTACGEAPAQTPAAEGRVLTDAAGREVTIPEAVESVVCVGVGALRYTCYVGGQDRVIGVEDYETKQCNEQRSKSFHNDSFLLGIIKFGILVQM